MADYDKELINSRIIEVCDYYVPGEGKAEGYKRRKWDCPECGGDNFTANTEQEIAGCFSPSCDVPQTTKAIGIIAYFEGYEMKGKEFVECLKRGYEILGIPKPEEGNGSRRSSKPRQVKPSKTKQTGEQNASSNGTTKAGTPEKGKSRITAPPSLPATLQLSNGTVMPAAGDEPEGQPSREFIHRVYSAWMELCPLVDSHREFWHGRGVNDETIAAGGFGSLSQDRCRYVLSALAEQFAVEELLTVPGFKRGPNGELHTNLFGEYTLIPYYDRDGQITTIEGRVPGEPEGKKPKYMAPVGAGSHLYVFPAFKPEHVMAFCEGLMGAVIAAQNGIAVASIKGCRCYRRSPAGKGKPYRVLAELLGVDFDGRPVYYIPDLDVKEKTRAEVEKAAPQAAKWLIEKQNGTAYLARLPEGAEDLDKWLLSMEEHERVTEFVKLTQTGITPKQWKGEEATQTADSHFTRQQENPAQNRADNQLDSPLSSENEEPQPEGNGDQKKAGGHLRQSVIGKPQTPDQQTASTAESNGHTPQNPHQETRQDAGANSPSQSARQPQHQPRGYKPIPKTNFGEFMVGLIYGGVAGVTFLMLALFAAPEFEPTRSLVSRVPVELLVIHSLIVVVVVLRIMVRRQYVRRWYALRDHLAGKK